MRILCLVKQVPDSLEVRMGSDLTLEREFVAQVLNPADESAVELALRLPTLLALRRAKNAPVAHLTHEDIALAREDCGLRGSPTRVTHVSARPSGVRHTVWLSAQEAAAAAAQLLEEVKP